eukprot:symbB.v1.2.017151.t1/scaffold1331.1/size125086/5
MASLAFLLLGAAASFVASVDPLEALTQKARQLQEITTLLAPMTAECASACPDMQSAYDEMECLVSKGTQEVLTGTVGLFCSHKSAFTCAAAQSACGSVLGNSLKDATWLDCWCSECPKSGHMSSDIATVAALTVQVLQGQTIDMGTFYTAACPLIGTVSCMESSSSCTSYLESQPTVTGMKNHADECTSNGYATEYTQPYTYGGCASEASAASGLVGLNLLFLTFSLLLLSIHK